MNNGLLPLMGFPTATQAAGAAAAGSQFANAAVFTTPGIFTVPQGVTQIKVTATGCGGAAQNNASGYRISYAQNGTQYPLFLSPDYYLDIPWSHSSNQISTTLFSTLANATVYSQTPRSSATMNRAWPDQYRQQEFGVSFRLFSDDGSSQQYHWQAVSVPSNRIPVFHSYGTSSGVYGTSVGVCRAPDGSTRAVVFASSGGGSFINQFVARSSDPNNFNSFSSSISSSRALSGTFGVGNFLAVFSNQNTNSLTDQLAWIDTTVNDVADHFLYTSSAWNWISAPSNNMQGIHYNGTTFAIWNNSGTVGNTKFFISSSIGGPYTAVAGLTSVGSLVSRVIPHPSGFIVMLNNAVDYYFVTNAGVTTTQPSGLTNAREAVIGVVTKSDGTPRIFSLERTSGTWNSDTVNNSGYERFYTIRAFDTFGAAVTATRSGSQRTDFGADGMVRPLDLRAAVPPVTQFGDVVQFGYANIINRTFGYNVDTLAFVSQVNPPLRIVSDSVSRAAVVRANRAVLAQAAGAGFFSGNAGSSVGLEGLYPASGITGGVPPTGTSIPSFLTKIPIPGGGGGIGTSSTPGRSSLDPFGRGGVNASTSSVNGGGAETIYDQLISVTPGEQLFVCSGVNPTMSNWPANVVTGSTGVVILSY